MRWLKKVGIQHRTTGLWLCTDGALTHNTNDPDLAVFVTHGGATRWSMAMFPDYLSAYRVGPVPTPGSRPSPPEAPK